MLFKKKNKVIKEAKNGLKWDWDNITIKQYEDIIELQKHIEEWNYTVDDLNVHLLSILSGKDMDYFYQMDYIRLRSLYIDLEFLRNAPKQDRSKIKDQYIINGKKYNIVASYTKIKGTQYIDYQNYLKDSPEDISKLISVFLIPDKKRYGDGYSPIELADEISNNLSIGDAVNIAFFLTILYRVLTKSILHSSIRQIKKGIKIIKKVEERERLMELLEVLKKQLKDLEASGIGK